MNLLTRIFDFIHVCFLKISLKSSKSRAGFFRDIHAVEDDSAWQLHRLYSRVEDPAVRSKVFLHILEEEGHAKIFKDGFHKETNTPFIAKQVTRTEIESEKEEVWKFFAHLSAGEKDAAVFFKKLKQAVRKEYLSEEISKVMEEELRHVSETVRAPKYLGVTDSLYLEHIQKVTAARKIDAWASRARIVLSFLINMLLFFIYYLLVPFFTFFSAKRLNAKKHVYPNNNRKTF